MSQVRAIAMTHPRQVLEERTYLVARRIHHDATLLAPSRGTIDIFLYCLGEAAERCCIDLLWVRVLPNHVVYGIHDPYAQYPQFLERAHKHAALAINHHLGRTENFWATEQTTVVPLRDKATLFHEMIQSLTRPVTTHLVDTVNNWPADPSLAYQLQNTLGRYSINRPAYFRETGSMPSSVFLTFETPPPFRQLSHAEWSQTVLDAITAVETATAVDRELNNIRIVGRRQLLIAPATRRRGRRRHARISSAVSTRAIAAKADLHATMKRWRRMENDQRDRVFLKRYRDAAMLDADGRCGTFPEGTDRFARIDIVPSFAEWPPPE